MSNFIDSNLRSTKYAGIIFISILTVLLTACSAGRSFVKPEFDRLVLGETTFKEVVDISGDPLGVRKLTVNNKEVLYIVYLYTSGSEVLLGGNAKVRTATFYFYDKRLVGYKYSSSFDRDSTDFDINKANQIEKNKTTIDKVYSLLGEPSSRSIYPMTENNNEKLVMYTYVGEEEHNKSVKIRHKDLKITYENSGVVTDISSLNRLE
jgi:hypothetical protein